MTPYGKAASAWKIDENRVFTQTVTVPAGTVCTLTMPSGKTQTLIQGTYTVTEPYQKGE